MRQACGRSCHQKKKEKRGKGGVRYEGRGVRVESRPDAGEKEQRTMHKDGEHCTMPRPRENGELKTDTDNVRRTRSEITQHAKHGQLKTGFGTRRPL